MTVIFGSVIVVIVLAVLLFLAVRYMIKQHKKGSCASCPYYQDGKCNNQRKDPR